MKFKRVINIVMDSVGIGAAHDADKYGDVGSDTFGHIAEHVGASIRSLFAGFRKYRNISPMRHLKEVRLERAHHDLAHTGEHNSVTEIALRWGFTHLGQFSASYQQRYGELPSATLKRRA